VSPGVVHPLLSDRCARLSDEDIQPIKPPPRGTMVTRLSARRPHVGRGPCRPCISAPSHQLSIVALLFVRRAVAALLSMSCATWPSVFAAIARWG